MTHIIMEPCVDVMDKACVDACPVDCIHGAEGHRMLYIHPTECIDCGACVDVCPPQAILPEDDVPDKWKMYIQINADFYKGQGGG